MRDPVHRSARAARLLARVATLLALAAPARAPTRRRDRARRPAGPGGRPPPRRGRRGGARPVGRTASSTSSPRSIAAVFAKAASAHFNVVYFQVRGQGDAYYRSALEPCAVALCGSLGNGAPPYDPLEVAVAEGRRHGIQVHAWVNAFTGLGLARRQHRGLLRAAAAERPGSPRHMLLDHPDWVMVRQHRGRASRARTRRRTSTRTCRPASRPCARTSPASPPTSRGGTTSTASTSTASATRRRSCRTTRPSVAAFGRAAPASDPAWQQWRRDAVSAAVREVHDSVAAGAPRGGALGGHVGHLRQPRARLAVGVERVDAVLPGPARVGRGGYLDVNVPMTYYRTQATRCAFTDWLCLLEDHLAGFDAATGRHTYVAITAAANVNSDAEVLDQIALGRARGVKGFAVYSYNAANARNLFALLGAGPFAKPAAVPVMAWKGAVRLARGQ
jgi:uncharacterized lipoprotein YddW (UPF0748 family)